MKNGGRPPLSYQSFVKLAGKPSCESSALNISISLLPPVGDVGSCKIFEVPTIRELGHSDSELV